MRMEDTYNNFPEQKGINLSVPCTFSVFKNGKEKRIRPAVNCAEFCDFCGFNPKEAQRRMETGRFCEVDHRFNVETGKLMTLAPGTVHLVFGYEFPQKRGE